LRDANATLDELVWRADLLLMRRLNGVIPSPAEACATFPAAPAGRLRGREQANADHPDLVSPKTGKARSLREIAEELERLGFVNGKGERFAAAQVARLIA
jgi:hypothetical protein